MRCQGCVVVRRLDFRFTLRFGSYSGGRGFCWSLVGWGSLGALCKGVGVEGGAHNRGSLGVRWIWLFGVVRVRRAERDRSL